MRLSHLSINPPLFWLEDRREFAMAPPLIQIANVTVHYPELADVRYIKFDQDD